MVLIERFGKRIISRRKVDANNLTITWTVPVNIIQKIGQIEKNVCENVIENFGKRMWWIQKMNI